MAARSSLGALDVEVLRMDLTEHQRAMLEWAGRFIEKHPAPPLTEKQREVLSTVGDCLPSLVGIVRD